MCNDEINMKEDMCPFCDEFLIKSVIYSDPCCEESKIVESKGMEVCFSCGVVHNSISKNDYIDFYANYYRIKRKSIYIRKYHIENTLKNLVVKYNIEMTYHQRNKIYKIFEQIGHILPEINSKRKRIININYIIKKILEMMNSSYEIPIIKSKKTLDFYNDY